MKREAIKIGNGRMRMTADFQRSPFDGIFDTRLKEGKYSHSTKVVEFSEQIIDGTVQIH